MSQVLKIYGSTLSANYRKVIAVAYELGISFEMKPVNVYQGDGQSQDYLSVSPLGQIPLIDDSGLVLRESNAIIIYLASKYGESRMYGSDIESQAIINQWLFWESSQWQPVLAEVMGAHVGHRLLPSVLPAPTSLPNWNADNCTRQLSFLESNLKDEWLAGSDVSLADFSVAAMMTYFACCGFPYDSYPNISRWYRQINTRECWLKSEDPLWSNPEEA